MAKLISTVVSVMSLECPIYMWTDSELVLKWILGSSRRWITFVANRVAEIQKISVESWRFIPGDINPADCTSRGLSADELLDFELWWKGPEFLSLPGLPIFVGKGIPESTNICEKSQVKLTHHVSHGTNVTNEWFGKFPDLTKLKRAVAYCMRFRHNCSVKLQERKFGELTASELGDAFTVLVKLA